MLKKITNISIMTLLFISCSSNEKTLDIPEGNQTKAPNEYTKDKDIIDYPLKLATINFEFDSSKVHTQQIHYLDEVSDALNKAPKDFMIIVKGHTDKIGPRSYNKDLGLERAKNVKNALIKQGIDQSKILTFSYGEEKPTVITNSTDLRRLNRRAEVEIVPAKEFYLDTTISLNQ